MASTEDLQGRLSALEQEVEQLRARERLIVAADEALERALRERMTLAQTLDLLFPLIGEHLGATGAWIRSFDEDLALRDYTWEAAEGGWDTDCDALYQSVVEAAAEAPAQVAENVVGVALDVAGEPFGAAGATWPSALSHAERDRAGALLKAWCEQLDNYLAAIAEARRKHQLVTSFADALKAPVLNDAIDQAVALMRSEVHVEEMILVYRHYDDIDGGTLAYKIMKRGEMLYDSRDQKDSEIDAFVRSQGIDMLLRGDTQAVNDRFDLSSFHEEVLISGLRPGQIVGRLLVGRAGGGDFSTFDRDLLHRFADFLRLRIVDFNREWRHLSLCFPRPVVRRLMGERDYVQRYLRPRVRDVAVLYCDIVSFTRVSEQILRSPALIGKLIDSWSERAVELIWSTGGVFDKMVGDCIIGLWGPPFFEMSDAEACTRAAEAAVAIRDYSTGLAETSGLKALKDAQMPMGVATGLNFCPLFVGRFGPNEGYTGFSSGMNNTARLQGQAGLNEIFCMESFAEALGARGRFGDPGAAQVKNVAEPLRYRPLLGLEDRQPLT